MVLKVEILLPLYDNNGKDILDSKFEKTYDIIINKFGAITVGSNPLLGNWVDPKTGILYANERFIACWIICDNTPSNTDYFRTLKKNLEEIFEQESIFIYHVEVNMIE